jgi:hypothetical protein
MDIRAAEISAILKEQIKNFGQEAEVSEIGQVLSVGDGIARVYGLDNCQAGARFGDIGKLTNHTQIAGIDRQAAERPNHAREQLERARDLNKKEPQTHFDLALVCLSQQDYVAAANELQVSVKLSPSDALAHVLLGRAYLNSNRSVQAIDEFKAALRIDRLGCLSHGRSVSRDGIARECGGGVQRGSRRRGIIDHSCELNRIVQRQIHQLLEPEVRDLAIALPLNHDRALVCARHLGAQQLELGHVADVARELRLPQHVVRLDSR